MLLKKKSFLTWFVRQPSADYVPFSSGTTEKRHTNKLEGRVKVMGRECEKEYESTRGDQANSTQKVYSHSTLSARS